MGILRTLPLPFLNQIIKRIASFFLAQTANATSHILASWQYEYSREMPRHDFMESSPKKTQPKNRGVLILTSFEIEVEGRSPCSLSNGVGAPRLGERELIEDADEDESRSEN